MKKVFAILLTLSLVIGLGTSVFAKGPKDKTVEVSLSITSEQEFEVVYVGDKVELQAVTAKHGSSYEDGWVVVDAGGNLVELNDYETVLTDVEGVNSYVSTATFVAEEAGTYTLKYSIEMAAGKSHVSFNGEAESEEIVVVDPEEAYITGVVVDKFNAERNGKSDNYKAKGEIYFTMSTGDKVLAQLFEITLNPSSNYVETINIEADGIVYTITVTKDGCTVN